MRALIFSLALFSAPALAAPKLACLEGFTPKAVSRSVGVETIHVLDGAAITIFTPMPATAKGRVLNINAMAFGERFPERFVLTDGTLRSAFVSLDLSPGSRLQSCVDELTSALKAELGARKDPVPSLVTFLDQYMDTVPEGFRYPWDRRKVPALPAEFYAAGRLDPGHYPLKTGLRQPTVPLESFLHEGRGVCQQRVMIASLILQRFGISHRVRAGGSGGGAGHIWIELADGRILDPTWHLLEKPTTKGAFPGWFRLSHTYLFHNQVYPFVADE